MGVVLRSGTTFVINPARLPMAAVGWSPAGSKGQWILNGFCTGLGFEKILWSYFYHEAGEEKIKTCAYLGNAE
jgi:hypothetical protein